MRTEKKYLISEVERSILIKRLSLTMKKDINSVSELNSSGYLVRSIYFDSIYDNDYLDKLSGAEKRKKIRLRIYSYNADIVRLELKEKQGDVQIKQGLWIKRELAEEMIDGNYHNLLYIDENLAKEIYGILECGVYRPRCIVEYKRYALVEKTNSTRITFDSDIRASRDFENFFSEHLFATPINQGLLLEVKYNRFLLGYIKDTLRYIDKNEESFSKYILCRNAIG